MTTHARRFRACPKTELHLHLEGTLERRRYLAWAREDGVPPRGGPPAPGIGYRDSRDFLARYAEGCRRLVARPERMTTLVADWVRRARRDGIVAAELTVSPVVFEKLGTPWREIVPILEAALDRAEQRGVRIGLLIDAVRQWGPAAAERALELQELHPLTRVVGFGVAGDETSRPAKEFRNAYDEARRRGLGTTLHAGEWAGAESVASGLDELGPDRIAHGVRAVEDPALIERLVRDQIPLDLAVTSNRATGATGSQHAIRELVRRGVAVTISTDDPTYFNCTLSGEAGRLVSREGLTISEVERILDRAFEVAFSRTRLEPVAKGPMTDQNSPSV